MLRRFVSSLLVLVLLSGCGAGGSSASASSTPASAAADMAAQIVEDLDLGDHMEELQTRVVQGLFFFEDGNVTDCSVYMNNNSSADVVGVFISTDLAETESKLSDYLDTQRSQMQSYYPDEVFKVDHAVLLDNGTDTVVLIVCDQLEDAKTEAETLLGISE